MTAPVKNGKGSLRWRPKEWLPIYEQIVVLSIAGRSNKDLASMFAYTEQHVCNILHTPEASLVRGLVLEKMRERAVEGIPAKLEATATKAAERIHDAIHDDELFEKSPFAIVDRSFRVLEAAGHIKSGDKPLGPLNVYSGGKAFILTEAAAERIRDTVKMLQEPTKEPPRDVEYEVVSAEPNRS